MARIQGRFLSEGFYTSSEGTMGLKDMYDAMRRLYKCVGKFINDLPEFPSKDDSLDVKMEFVLALQNVVKNLSNNGIFEAQARMEFRQLKDIFIESHPELSAAC